MITRSGLADEIDTYDQSIADLNKGKKDCFDAYRDQMIKAGVAKENVRKEIEAVKAAIRRRRAAAKDAVAVEEKDALVDEIFAEISAAARAPRARVEIIDEFQADAGRSDASPDLPEHDHETGELIEESPDMGAGLAGPALAGSLPAANIKPAPHSDPAASILPAAGRADDAANPPAVSSADLSPSAAILTADLTGEAPKPPETQASPVGTLSEPFEPPAFLRKAPVDYRPHCLNPGNCGSSSIDKHCHTCRKAIEAAREAEAA